MGEHRSDAPPGPAARAKRQYDRGAKHSEGERHPAPGGKEHARPTADPQTRRDPVGERLQPSAAAGPGREPADHQPSEHEPDGEGQHPDRPGGRQREMNAAAKHGRGLPGERGLFERPIDQPRVLRPRNHRGRRKSESRGRLHGYRAVDRQWRQHQPGQRNQQENGEGGEPDQVPRLPGKPLHQRRHPERRAQHREPPHQRRCQEGAEELEHPVDGHGVYPRFSPYFPIRSRSWWYSSSERPFLSVSTSAAIAAATDPSK